MEPESITLVLGSFAHFTVTCDSRCQNDTAGKRAVGIRQIAVVTNSWENCRDLCDQTGRCRGWHYNAENEKCSRFKLVETTGVWHRPEAHTSNTHTV